MDNYQTSIALVNKVMSNIEPIPENRAIYTNISRFIANWQLHEASLSKSNKEFKHVANSEQIKNMEVISNE